MDRVERLVQERFAEACANSNRLVHKTNLDNLHQIDARETLSSKNSLDLSTIRDVAAGMAAIPTSEFIKTIDMGIPMDVEYRNHPQSSSNVLVLYGSKATARTRNTNHTHMDPSHPGESTTAIPVVSSTDQALERCMELVVFPVHTQRSCLALVPYPTSNYHAQKWMRISPIKKKRKYEPFSKDQPLRLVGSNLGANGIDENIPPSERHFQNGVDILQNYLNLLEEALRELKTLTKHLKPYKRGNGKRVITVMVCNFGQSELIMNFACNAKARGIDTSSVLIFAADKDTHDLVTSLGLTAYHNEKMFGNIPHEAAKHYGDNNFIALMTMKVISVHLISQLGFDILFQDADVVWFRHPIKDYFDDKNRWTKEYDIIFQEDGSRSLRFSPYDANSGFYFIDNNQRSRAFVNAMLFSMPSIVSSKSHQHVLINTLSEHVLAYGLVTKVISRESPDLPCGYQWHRKPHMMKNIFSGKVEPIVFHMSWTENKDNKIKFFQQMGEWYVDDQCVGKTTQEIASESLASTTTVGGLREHCCLSTTNFKCHYRDKPSLHNCRDSPALDGNYK